MDTEISSGNDTNAVGSQGLEDHPDPNAIRGNDTNAVGSQGLEDHPDPNAIRGPHSDEENLDDTNAVGSQGLEDHPDPNAIRGPTSEKHPGAINVGDASGVIPGMEDHLGAVNVGNAPGIIPGMEENPGAVNIGDASGVIPGQEDPGAANVGDAPGVIPGMEENPGAVNLGDAPGVIPGQEDPGAVNVGHAPVVIPVMGEHPGAANVGDAVGGGDDTGFDPFFLADLFLLHQAEDDPLIEWRDPSGRLPEAELLVHQQAPSLPPGPEAAPVLPPGPEAGPGLPPGPEAGPGLQPDPEVGGPGLQPDPEAGGPGLQPDPEAGGPGLPPGPEEAGPGLPPGPEARPGLQVDPVEGSVPHAFATLFPECSDFMLITSKILTPSDVNRTRSRLLLPSGDLHMLESTGQVLVMFDPEVRQFEISLTKHRRGGSSNKTSFVFTHGWSDLVTANGFQAGTVIQLWTFLDTEDRRCFLVVPV